jgi:hypothetical protein
MTDGFNAITFLCFQWQPQIWYSSVSAYLTVVKVKYPRYRPRVAQRVSRDIALLSQDLGTRRGWGVSVTPRPLSTPGKDPVPHCTGGWVGPRADLDRCGKSRPHRDSIPGPSSPQSVAIPTELPGPHLTAVSSWNIPSRTVIVISYILLTKKAHTAGNVIGNCRFIIMYPSIIRLNCLRVWNNFQQV